MAATSHGSGGARSAGTARPSGRQVRAPAAAGPAQAFTAPQVHAVADPDVTGVAGCEVLAVALAGPARGEKLPQPRHGVAEVALATGIDLATVCEQVGFTGSAGAVLRVPLGVGRAASGTGDESWLPERLLLVGTGDESATALRRAGAGLARAVRGAASVGSTLAAGLGPDAVRDVVEGLLLGAWSPPRAGVTDPPDPPPGHLRLVGCTHDDAVRRAVVASAATWTARDLTAMPSSTKDPAWVADRARDLAAGRDGVDVEVLDEADLAAAGFGGLLAVGRGSASPPRLVRVTWTPGAGRGPGRHVVLVGKGITYDTGGLSIKPREAMVPMKTDMAGAAVVLAAVLGAADLDLPHRVTALLPLAENAVGASSYRPGDVVTVRGGTTVEIANTDAEGRVVLADALAWAAADLDPDVLVDVATLTGSASLGLGRRHAALFSGDDALAAELAVAADSTGERVWRMPLVEDYRRALDSEVADLRHVPADRHVSGGAITAALFLREFTGDHRWAHLDVAGPARSDREAHEVPKGATGFGARLLLRWLETLPAG